MKYFTTDLQGITLINPDEDARREVLESVHSGEAADFPEVFLSVEGGPILGYRTGGVLAWEEDGEVLRVLKHVDTDTACRIWDRAIGHPADRMNELDWIDLPPED